MCMCEGVKVCAMCAWIDLGIGVFMYEGIGVEMFVFSCLHVYMCVYLYMYVCTHI